MNGKIDSAYLVGQMHLQRKELCHDRTVSLVDDGRLVLALADGMGHPQFRCPDIGAQFAVDFIAANNKEIHDLIDTHEGEDGDLKEGLHKILERMIAEAFEYSRKIGARLRDMSCTLSFCIIGPKMTIAAAIGDSPLYVETRNGLNFVYGNGEIGEADTHTECAFNPRSIEESMKVHVCPTDDVESVLMMSDGCLGYAKEDELRKFKEAMPEWFESVKSGEMDAEKLVLNLAKAGYDDCSIAYFIR